MMTVFYADSCIAFYTGDRNNGGRNEPFFISFSLFFNKSEHFLGNKNYRIVVTVSNLSEKMRCVFVVITRINVHADCRKALYAFAVADNGNILAINFTQPFFYGFIICFGADSACNNVNNFFLCFTCNQIARNRICTVTASFAFFSFARLISLLSTNFSNADGEALYSSTALLQPYAEILTAHQALVQVPLRLPQ